MSFNLVMSVNVKVALYSSYFDTRPSSEFFPSCCFTICMPYGQRHVFVASCTSHFGAQPVFVALFAPICTYLSPDTGDVRSNAPCVDMCSDALRIAYRPVFTLSTPGYDNVWTVALTFPQNQTFYCLQNSLFFTACFDEIWPSSGNTKTHRGADKSLAQPGKKQVRKHVRDARDFNNIETRAVIKLFFGPSSGNTQGIPGCW